MKKTILKITGISILTGINSSLNAQITTGNADVNNILADISTYAGYGFGVVCLLCIVVAGYNFLLAENGAATGKKYIFGAIGAAILWALADKIVMALFF